MTLSRTDRSELQHCIRSQKRKVNAELDKIVKQKCTQSAYPAMSRQDKRIAEHHADRISQESSLQRDMQKADRMADRIAQVLEQLRSDFNQIKNHIGNYDFPAEEPNGATGDCSNDFSAALDTRQAWKETLCCMLKNVRNYSNQQYLGDYKILHNQGGNGDGCCPLGHRAEFKYKTPVGDCLRVESSGSMYTTSVQNADLKIESLYTQLCVSPVDSPEAEEILFNQVLGIVNAAIDTADTLDNNNTAAKAALSAAGFSDAMVDSLSVKPTGVTDAVTFVEAVISCTMPAEFENASASVAFQGCEISAPGDSNGNVTTDPGANGPLHYVTAGGAADDTTRLNTLFGWRYGKDGSATFLELAPIVGRIADECDDTFNVVKETVIDKMNEIRKAQLQNDADKKTIAYVREVSECNEAYHEQVYGEHTTIDESELCKRYEVGSAMLADLDNMYRENCVSKQSFFKDITRNGCC